jgi:hypothetical protein
MSVSAERNWESLFRTSAVSGGVFSMVCSAYTKTTEKTMLNGLGQPTNQLPCCVLGWILGPCSARGRVASTLDCQGVHRSHRQSLTAVEPHTAAIVEPLAAAIGVAHS